MSTDNLQENKKFVILGAGITGLTVGYKLAQKYGNRVLIIEKSGAVGGLAGTVRHGDLKFDLGSHRIHPNSDPHALALIKELLGSDLLHRPRLGFIRIQKKYLKYPPSIFDFLFKFGYKRFTIYLFDYIVTFFLRIFRWRWPADFESYAMLGVGKSLYRDFYAPYAQKLWGLSPNQLSSEPAVSRMRKFEIKHFFGELFGLIRKASGRAYYLYPAGGIGQIADRLRTEFEKREGEIFCAAQLKEIKLSDDCRIDSIDFIDSSGMTHMVPVEMCISTIPLPENHKLIHFSNERNGSPPFPLRYRALRILYLITRDKIPADNETFYFPDPAYHIGRVSEVRKYSPSLNNSIESSVLTIEIPCTEGDAIWKMGDGNLYNLCRKELVELGVLYAMENPEASYFSVFVPQLYPVFDLGWRERLDAVMHRLDGVENLFLIGRAGLFLHCNFDHCMVMALKLHQFLKSGASRDEWKKTREEFMKFQVKD